MGDSAPKTPTYALSHTKASGISSLCPPLFAPHYVAWKASRCRRFIGDAPMALVCSYPLLVAHRANQTAAVFAPNIERSALLAKFKPTFQKFKVRSFRFCVFCNSQKCNFADFAFLIFRFGDCRSPAGPGHTRVGG